jgi:hypothetical protein
MARHIVAYPIMMPDKHGIGANKPGELQGSGPATGPSPTYGPVRFSTEEALPIGLKRHKEPNPQPRLGDELWGEPISYTYTKI